MGSGWRLGSRTRRFTKKTLAFIVPLALLISMMLSNAPLASAQDASPSPTADPSPTEEPTTAPTLAPSASDAPSTDAPSPTDSPSATDASPAPPPETTPTEPAAPSVPSSPAATNYASLIVRTVPGLTDADVVAATAAGGGTEVSSVPALRLHVVQVDAATVADSIATYSADARVESVDRDRTRDAERSCLSRSMVTSPDRVGPGVRLDHDLRHLDDRRPRHGGAVERRSDGSRLVVVRRRPRYRPQWARYVGRVDRRRDDRQRSGHRRRRLRRHQHHAGAGARRDRYRSGLGHHRRPGVGGRSRRERRGDGVLEPGLLERAARRGELRVEPRRGRRRRCGERRRCIAELPGGRL